MKVLFYTYPTAFQNPGGGETVLLKTREYLKNLGLEVDLFNLWETKISHYDIVHCFASTTYQFWFAVKEYRKNLVVTPTFYPHDNLKTIFMARTKYFFKKHVFKERYKWSTERAFHLVDKFTVPSSSEAKALTRYFNLPEQVFEIVPNGVDIKFADKVDDSFRKKFNLKEYILSVGRIVSNKNQLSLIKACKKVGMPLVIIGEPDPDSIDYFKQCIVEGKDNTIFAGYISHDDPLLHSAYQHCSVFVLPSFRETCGMAAVEAGTAGAKVIVSDLPTTREYFKEHAVYIKPGDIESIIAGIKAVLNNKCDNRLQEHILENYTWDKIAQKLLSAYHSLMKKT